MIEYRDEKTNTINFIVGGYWVVNFKPDDEKSGFLIKDPADHQSYMAAFNNNQDWANVFTKLTELMQSKPFECGRYEDWRFAVDVGLDKVTEAVARQYEALDYILVNGEHVDTAMYMLNRIENSYASFLEVKQNEGDQAAHEYLERLRKKTGGNELKTANYYARVLERVESGVPLCLDFFQENNPGKYINQLTLPQGLIGKPRIPSVNIRFEDILLEYINSNKFNKVA